MQKPVKASGRTRRCAPTIINNKKADPKRIGFKSMEVIGIEPMTLCL